MKLFWIMLKEKEDLEEGSQLIKRIMVAVLALPIIIFAIFEQFTGGVVFLAFLLVCAFLSVNEYLFLVKDKIDPWTKNVTTIGTIIFVGLTFIVSTELRAVLIKFFFGNPVASKSVVLIPLFFRAVVAFFGYLILIFFFLVLGQLFKKDFKRSLEDILLGFFPVIYIGIGFGVLNFLMHIPLKGPFLVFYTFMIIWLTDSFALIIGKFFGKHKLGISVSPNKTIEGVVGGVIFALIGAVCLKLGWPEIFSGWRFFSWPVFLTSTFFLSFIAQIGDLLESLLKRSAGVKDSSILVPGHGGILDVFDSLIFMSPFLFFLVAIFVF